MFSFIDNRKSVKDIVTMVKDSELIVDDTYQRRSVWGEKDKIRLVETILLNLIIPVLFFWKAETDPDTGSSITHIVDGQQRVKAICSFVNNEFKLKPQYLLDKNAKELYGNKFFRDLSSEEKKLFWNYQLMVIDIDPSATRDDIVTMFNRLNLTDYNLNDQEKRNSMSGEFAVLARELSENSIWDEKHLFTTTDVRRMKDVEFCASLILLFKKGIIDQTDQTALNQAYEDYQVGYSDAEEDKEKILDALDNLHRFFISESVAKFLRKRSQLYTIFCIIFYMQRKGLSVSKVEANRLSAFVELYSYFSNDLDLSDMLDENEKIVFDSLKKYKLASSEGLNKHTNRMIRYNILKAFIMESAEGTLDAEQSLLEKLKNYHLEVKDDPDE